jgi:small subunit ribosomal protein S7
MLKFAEIERLKRLKRPPARITGGFCKRGWRIASVRERIKLANKQGAILDKRLTNRLYSHFKKNYIAFSAIRLFANRLLRCGKKRKAENMVIKAALKLRKLGEQRPLSLFKKAIESVHTPLSVRIYKKGRKTIYIPYLMRTEAAYNMSARHILSACREDRLEKGMSACLSAEVKDIADMRGEALKRKFDLETLISENIYSYRFIRPFRRRRGQFRK